MGKVIIKLEDFCKSYGKKEIIKNLNLEVYEGEFLTLLGASGCGKTTILRSISGIDSITSGKIYLDDKDVTDLDATKREVNTIFQNYALFPHMTVEENIGFGLKMKGINKKTIEKKVKEMLELVRLKGYEKRMPSELSGGEQQRVSIARGLINKPKVLLLDEPISALDLKLKKQMQVELKQLQRKTGITFIYVTHNQDEALTMSNRIVLLRNGKIEQIDTPENIYRHPVSKYVADFIGESTVFNATVDKIELNYTFCTLEDKYKIKIRSNNYEKDEKLQIVFRPEDLRLSKTEKEFQAMPVVIKENIYDGSLTKVLAENNGREIKISVDKDGKTYERGTELFINWDVKDIIVIRKEKHEKN